MENNTTSEIGFVTFGYPVKKDGFSLFEIGGILKTTFDNLGELQKISKDKQISNEIREEANKKLNEIKDFLKEVVQIPQEIKKLSNNCELFCIAKFSNEPKNYFFLIHYKYITYNLTNRANYYGAAVAYIYKDKHPDIDDLISFLGKAMFSASEKAHFNNTVSIEVNKLRLQHNKMNFDNSNYQNYAIIAINDYEKETLKEVIKSAFSEITSKQGYSKFFATASQHILNASKSAKMTPIKYLGFLNDVEPPTEKIGDTETTKEEIGDTETTIEEVGNTETTTEKIGDAETPTEKIGDTETPTEKIGDTETTTEKIGDTETTTEEVGDIETTIVEDGNTETTIEEVGDIETATEEIGDTETTTEEIGDADTTTEKIGDTKSTTEKIGDIETTIEKIGDTKSTTEKIGDIETTIEKIGDAETLNKDNVKDGNENGETETAKTTYTGDPNMIDYINKIAHNLFSIKTLFLFFFFIFSILGYIYYESNPEFKGKINSFLTLQKKQILTYGEDTNTIGEQKQEIILNIDSCNIIDLKAEIMILKSDTLKKSMLIQWLKIELEKKNQPTKIKISSNTKDTIKKDTTK